MEIIQKFHKPFAYDGNLVIVQRGVFEVRNQRRITVAKNHHLKTL